MARSYAQIHQRIWADPTWRALGVDAQHLYLLLISQPQMNLAGVLPLQLRKWSSCVAGWDIADVAEALGRLRDDRFVLVDEDTEEVLVRSLIRNDGGYKTPGVLKSILKFAEATQAEALRRELAVELGRLDRLDGKTADEGMALIAATRLALLPNGTPPDGGVIHRSDAIPDAIPDGLADAMPDTYVSVSGSVPRLSLVGSVVGGSSPAPTAEPPKCKRHEGMAREDVPSCGACYRRRVRWEEDQAQTASLIAAEAAKPKPMCPEHHGQIAAHCGPCRSEKIAARKDVS
jgi:hypothetical protein